MISFALPLLLLFICVAIFPKLKPLNRILLILFEVFYVFLLQILLIYSLPLALYILISLCNILFHAKVFRVRFTRSKLIFLIIFEFILLVISFNQIIFKYGSIFYLSNIFLIPVFLSARFISNRVIYKSLLKTIRSSLIIGSTNLQKFGESKIIGSLSNNLLGTNQNSLRIGSTNLQRFNESELISFIDKIKEGDFPKASISKSSIDGDYVIVRDLNGVVLSQIKISEVSKYL